MTIRPMTEEHIKEIFTWRYPPPYDFYDIEEDADTFRELLQDDYFAVLSEDDNLLGFYAYGRACRVTVVNSKIYDSPALDYGLGLRPDLTGKGMGLDFVLAGMVFGKERYHPLRFRLTVADFNLRAMEVYRRAGFHFLGFLTSARNQVKFQVMETKKFANS